MHYVLSLKKKSQEGGDWLPGFKFTIVHLNRPLKFSVPEFSHSQTGDNRIYLIGLLKIKGDYQ